MTALATDAFTRANAANLGANWTGTGGGAATGLQIVSNAASNTANGGGDEWAKYTAITWTDNQYSQAKATISSSPVGGTGDGPGVAVRIASGSTKTMYRFVVNNNSNGVEVSKFVAGAYTQLGTRSVTYGAGNVLYGEAQGSTLIVQYNGSALGASLSDSAVTSGSAGLAHSGPGADMTIVLDDWEGGDFAGGGGGSVAARRLPLLGVG